MKTGRRRLSNLGVFTTAEQSTLIAALKPDASPEERRGIMDFCANHCALGTAESNERFAARQRKVHSAAKKIERLAIRIVDICDKVRLPEEEKLAKAILADVRGANGQLMLRGRPHRSIFQGATRLALWHLTATGKQALSRSRSSPFADVLRIVYRVVDPLPIIDEIIWLGDSSMRPHLRVLRKVPKL